VASGKISDAAIFHGRYEYLPSTLFFFKGQNGFVSHIKGILFLRFPGENRRIGL
jgi:hypothetical protein